jgi:hypothetical protein
MFCGKVQSDKTPNLKHVAVLREESKESCEVLSNARRKKSICSKRFWVALVNTRGNGPTVVGRMQPILNTQAVTYYLPLHRIYAVNKHNNKPCLSNHVQQNL